jgi:hypothetical protein
MTNFNLIAQRSGLFCQETAKNFTSKLTYSTSSILSTGNQKQKASDHSCRFSEQIM